VGVLLETEPVALRAVVTGGGSGLGRAVALRLARADVTVFVLGRRLEMLEETVASAAPGTVVAVQCDIRDPAQVDTAFEFAEETGPVPLLVGAAAGAFLSPAEDISPNGFNAVVAATLSGPFFVLRRWARPLLQLAMDGTAILVTSAFAEREEPGVAHSAAAKAGVEALIRSVAVEWGPRGLRVNGMAPGAFETEGATAGMWSDGAVRAAALVGIPLGRFGSTDEMTDAVAFLASKAAGYINGEILVVDGGWRLGGYPFGHALPAPPN
jgi:NAD(P)-dependent dehydrogenase (short-subunit alcohol dehydrogenase family)